jgi:hypothetical protein
MKLGTVVGKAADSSQYEVGCFGLLSISKGLILALEVCLMRNSSHTQTLKACSKGVSITEF